MHELSIAQNLADLVRREQSDRGLGRIHALTVRIGELTDVYPEALEFGFQMLTRGTDLDGVRLLVERVPVVARCRQCEKDIIVEQMVFICSECGSTDIEIFAGLELEVAYLEVDDNPE